MTTSILLLGLLPLVVLATIFTPILADHLKKDRDALSVALLGSVSAEATRILDGPRHLLPTALLLTDELSQGPVLDSALRALALPTASYSAIMILDAQNRIIDAFPDSLLGRTGPYTTQVPIRLGITSFSPPFVSGLTGTAVVEASYSNGEHSAVCLVDLGAISSLLLHLALSPDDRLGMVDAEGRYVLSSDPSRVKWGEVVDKSLLGPDSYLYKEGGSEFFVTSLTLPGSDWRAVYFRLRSSAEAPLREFVTRFLVVLLLALLSGLGLSLRIYRTVSQPFSFFLEKISGISQGRYDERITGVFVEEFQTIAGALNSMADSIERRDRKIQESEERYRLLFHGAKVPAFLLSMDGQIVDANSAASAYYGRAFEDLLGLSIADLCGDVCSDTLASLAIAADLEVRGVPEVHTLATGEKRHVELYPSRLNIDGLSYLHCVVFDVTRRDEAEVLLRGALDEKTLLLREIYHRVKNNLQVISSLLYMQATSVQDPGVVAALQAGQQRVTAMSLAHELVYQMNDLRSIDSQEYCDRLLSYLSDSYGVSRSRIEASVQSYPLELEVALPFGLAFSEIVSNAFKYGSDEGKGTILHLSLGPSVAIPGDLTLTVRDSGPGLPPGRDLPVSPSLGLTLVKALAEQLGGKAQWLAPATGGTEVVFDFRWRLS